MAVHDIRLFNGSGNHEVVEHRPQELAVPGVLSRQGKYGMHTLDVQVAPGYVLISEAEDLYVVCMAVEASQFASEVLDMDTGAAVDVGWVLIREYRNIHRFDRYWPGYVVAGCGDNTDSAVWNLPTGGVHAISLNRDSSMLRKSFAMLVLATVVLGGCNDSAPEAPDTIKDVERIVFFGDSITQAGAEPGGYVRILEDSLTARYPDKDIEVIGAGISGNKVPDLQARLERDVLAHDPTTVVIYIGINDVWHWELPNHTGTSTADYEAGLRAIVDTLQTSGARVLLCTPSVIGEKHDGTNPQDAMLDEYAGISRSVAQELGAETCDLRADFIAYLRAHNTENKEKDVLTTDGVHLNPAGNQFVADRILQALERRRERM